MKSADVLAYAGDPPSELKVAIEEFFAPDEQSNALAVSWLESRWNAFALNDTTSAEVPCGTVIGAWLGVIVSAERSVGYFQIDSCNYPTWEWQRLYNARHNVGTAHMIWAEQGWRAWYFSAKTLGLL